VRNCIVILYSSERFVYAFANKNRNITTDDYHNQPQLLVFIIFIDQLKKIYDDNKKFQMYFQWNSFKKLNPYKL